MHKFDCFIQLCDLFSHRAREIRPSECCGGSTMVRSLGHIEGRVWMCLWRALGRAARRTAAHKVMVLYSPGKETPSQTPEKELGFRLRRASSHTHDARAAHQTANGDLETLGPWRYTRPKDTEPLTLVRGWCVLYCYTTGVGVRGRRGTRRSSFLRICDKKLSGSAFC